MQALLYTLSVLFTVAISSTALSNSRVYQSMTASFIPRHQLALLGTIVTEYPFFFIAAKLFILYELSGQNLFSGYWLGKVYYLDISNILFYWSLFLQAVFSRHPVYEYTKFMRNRTSSFPPTIFTFSFWFRFHNPFWSSRPLLKQENITYATDEELKEMKSQFPNSQKFVTLDVYQHPSFPRQCPVVIYIHGGQWKSGSKDDVPPIVPSLTLKKYVVVSINHRLAPNVTIVDQLIDIKRAIRWVRQNITKFGGNPSFISVVGSSSGAHLATMASMTVNEPQFQPGFEAVDTSIQACVSLGL
jgi:hypothetical protein